MIIRADAAFFKAMRVAGHDLDRKRLLQIYNTAKALRLGLVPGVITAAHGVVMTWNCEQKYWTLSGHEGLTEEELDKALKPVEEILGPPDPKGGRKKSGQPELSQAELEAAGQLRIPGADYQPKG